MSIGERRIAEFSAQVGAKSSTPGGGAVAGVCGALASSLAAMVTRYSQGREQGTAHEPLYAEMVGAFDRAKQMFTELADEDTQAYQRLSDAMKRPKDDPQRPGEMAEAVRGAAGVPLAVMGLCLSLLRRYEALAPIANPWLKSDLAIACELTASSGRAASYLVSANASLLETHAPGDASLAESERMVSEIDAIRARVLDRCG